MSQVHILAARSPIAFESELVSCSPTISTSISISFNDKTTNTLLDRFITTPAANDAAPAIDDGRDEFAAPGLPPVHHGHIDTHLRNGVMKAAELAADGEPDAEKAFFVADLSYVYLQHLRWKRLLPEIEPFYGECACYIERSAPSNEPLRPFAAVKCNPDPYVLRLLKALGTGFDCASNGEISQVLSLGVDPSRVIFANPCKAASFVRQASKAGVDMMTFDNTDELYKIARAHPGAKLVVRILTDDSKSLCRLGLKYGAPLVTVPGLLAKAKELDLNVIGVSFHVGSGCYDTSAYVDAIARARAAFDMGKAAGYDFTLLDVGGGFEDATFERAAAILKDALDAHFPVRDRLRIIAEPGRYYVSKAFSLAVNVIARRAPPGLEGAGEDSEEADPEQPSVMCT